MRVMAATPYGSWAACPPFGLRELLELSGTARERIELAVNEMNKALQELGIADFRVEDLTRESRTGEDASEWIVTLATTSERSRTFSFAWSVRR